METNPIKEENGNSSASLTPQKPDCDDETKRDGKMMAYSNTEKGEDSDGAEYKQAIKNHQRILDIAKKVGDTDTEGDAYFDLSNAYYHLSEYKQCIEYSELALHNAEELGKTDRVGRAYCNLGTGFEGFGDLNRAMEYYELSLDIAKELENRDLEACAYPKLGTGYLQLGDFKKAVEYFRGSLDIAEKMGDTDAEKRAYINIGDAYHKLGDYKQSIEYSKLALRIAKELGDRDGEEEAYINLIITYDQLGDYQQSIEYSKLTLRIAKEVGDRDGEEEAYIKLGTSYNQLGDYKQSIEYSKLALRNAKELGNRAGERSAYCILGSGYKGFGDLKSAMEYYKLGLDIAKELENRDLEVCLYGNLGAGYQQLGDFKQAVEYYLGWLEIVKQAGDTTAEGEVYRHLGAVHLQLGDFKQAVEYFLGGLDIAKQAGNTDVERDVYFDLSAVYNKLGDFKQSIEYSKLSLLNAKEQGDRDREGNAYGNLGTGYQFLGDLKSAMHYHKLSLDIAKELGDKDGETRAYCQLGVGYARLGDFKQAVKYYLGSLDMAQKMGDMTAVKCAYFSLGSAYRSLEEYKEALKYHQQCLDIAKKEGDKEMEMGAYCEIGLVYKRLLDFEQSIEYQKKSLHIAKELGSKNGEGRACLNLGFGYRRLGNFEQAKEYCQRALEICKETGDKDGVGRAYFGCGLCSENLGNTDEALLLYEASIKQQNEMRLLLQSEDDWNINFRSQYQGVYDRFQNLLLKQKKIVEALSTAEYGRAQALEDLLHSQYGFEAVQSDESELGSTEIAVYTKSPVLYVAGQENVIQMWMLQEGEVALFTQEEIDANQLKSNDAGDLKSFIHNTVKNISSRNKRGYRCEDRTLDDVEETDVGSLREETPEELAHPLSELRTENVQNEDLIILYDVTVGAVVDLIHGTDLIIVPDGPLLLAPFAAFVNPKSRRYLCESFRIRILPSLTSLKMISLSPPDYHCERGALIVGDPCLKKIVKRRGKPVFSQLKCAREEAEMIGSILNVKPLIGKDATKAEVLERLNTVALIHIAAHGDSKTGEIALAPNPSADSKVPKKDEYMLTMAEVLNVGLRARLVVLSCCNSGRGEIKAEGVVGISRAFLGAGARSVLVSLWAIEDEATLEFMRSFYQQLVDGKSASEALNQAMKCMRESQKFNAVKQWAPFVLIGDDVTLDFKGETDHAPNDSASGGTTSALESPISLDAQKKKGEIKGIRSQPPGKMTFCRGRMFWRLPGFIVGAAETQMTNQDEEDSIPIMDRMTNTINILKEGRYSDIGPVIGTVAKDILQPSNKTRDQQLLQKYCDHLCEIGAPAQLTMFLRRLIDIGMETEEGWKGMIIVRATLWNYSGASLKMASALGQSGALEMMLNDLDTYGPKQSKHEQKSFLVSSAVSILHNCAKASENRQIFCNLRAVERIAPLLKAEDMEVVMTAILTLSYITTDEQKDLLEADRKVISYFLGILRNSLNQPDLRESGWSALEIAVGLGNIAVNERNRETMIDREAISLLVSLLIKGGDTEKECAANALWVLVKDSRGKAKLKETPEAMEELSRLSNSGNHSVQEAVNRVLIALKEAAEGTRDDRVEECSREEQVLPD